MNPLNAPNNSPILEAEKEEEVCKGWVIVVHNDNHHTFRYVTELLCKIVSVPLDEAIRLTLEIHHEGQAVVAGPMSQVEAQSTANKICTYGPDPYSVRPNENVGLKATVEQL